MNCLLYESCRPIKGYNRSIIYDLQRNNYDFIPNDLHSLLNNSTINVEDDNLEIKDYFDFLFDNEYIFKMNNPLLTKGFTKLNLGWYSPSIIENTILNIADYKGKPSIARIISFLNQLNCIHIQLNISAKISIENLKELMNLFEDTKIDTVELIVGYNNYAVESVKSFCKKYFRIKNIIVYSSPFKKIHNFGSDSLSNIVFLKTDEITLLNSGVKEYQFTSNYSLFTESQNHHTYFNRKLYIGSKGEIKNAPECEETFGNINDIKDVEELKQIIATPEFQKYWFVHKELCDVCKDCEFRHMCVDNRLPYQRKDGIWYHKIECNYNPYICKWKEEEGYQTLAEIGVLSNEDGFSVNHEKIATINEVLWAD